MLPSASIAAIEWNQWVHTQDAAKIMGIYTTDVYMAAKKYKVDNYKVCGRSLYYKPDVERAALEIAVMRTKRAAKAEATS